VPFFGGRPIGKIVAADVERFMVVKRAEGRSPKSVRNWLGVLHTLAHRALLAVDDREALAVQDQESSWTGSRW
jgi:hypothetical protein